MIITAQPLPMGTVAGHSEVWVDYPPSSAATVTVVRKQERREFLTRGLVDVRADSDIFARDFEAPFGAGHVYEATAFDEAGAVIERVSSERLTLQSVRSSTVVIHDPVRPGKSITLALGKNAIRGGSRTLTGGAVEVTDSSLPIAITGRRNGWSRLALDVVTYQESQAEELDEMFGGYDDDSASGVLCFRVASNVPSSIPRTFFGRVDSPTPEWWPRGDGNGNRRAEWSLTALEVRPPAPAVVEPLVTWADWTAWMQENGGWAGLRTAFPTLRDWNRSLAAYAMADQ